MSSRGNSSKRMKMGAKNSASIKKVKGKRDIEDDEDIIEIDDEEEQEDED